MLIEVLSTLDGQRLKNEGSVTSPPALVVGILGNAAATVVGCECEGGRPSTDADGEKPGPRFWCNIFAPLNAPLKAPLKTSLTKLLLKYSKELSKEFSKEQNFAPESGPRLADP